MQHTCIMIHIHFLSLNTNAYKNETHKTKVYEILSHRSERFTDTLTYPIKIFKTFLTMFIILYEIV